MDIFSLLAKCQCYCKFLFLLGGVFRLGTEDAILQSKGYERSASRPEDVLLIKA